MSFAVHNNVFQHLGISAVAHLGCRRAPRKTAEPQNDSDTTRKTGVYFRCPGMTLEMMQGTNIGRPRCKRCPCPSESNRIRDMYDDPDDTATRSLQLFCSICAKTLTFLAGVGQIKEEDIEQLQDYATDPDTTNHSTSTITRNYNSVHTSSDFL